MSTWIKPAVGWGIVDNKNCLWKDQWETKKDAELSTLPTDKVIRVVQVPYTVARKAGLLRRPKP